MSETAIVLPVRFDPATKSIEVLLVKKRDETKTLPDGTPKFYHGKWAMPGGTVEDDEAPDDGAKREQKEETGYELNTGPFFVYSEKQTADHTVYLFISIIKLGQEPVAEITDLKIVEERWFPVGDAPRNEMYFKNHLRLFDAVAPKIEEFLQSGNPEVLKIEKKDNDFSLDPTSAFAPRVYRRPWEEREERAPRTYEAICATCGKQFQDTVAPQEGRRRDCPECHRQYRERLHDVPCTWCGQAATIGFEPREGQVVLCRECSAQESAQREGLIRTVRVKKWRNLKLTCEGCGEEHAVRPDVEKDIKFRHPLLCSASRAVTKAVLSDPEFAAWRA